MSLPVLAVNLATEEVMMFKTRKECMRVIGVKAPAISAIIAKKQRKAKARDGKWYTFDYCNSITKTDEYIHELIEWARVSTCLRTKSKREHLLQFLYDEDVHKFLDAYVEDPNLIQRVLNNNI